MQFCPVNLSFARRLASALLCALAAASLVVDPAIASGFPPIANTDEIVVVQGGVATTLSDGSTSILTNDFDAEGDSLFIFLTQNVSRGTLTLNQRTGTFIYRHNGLGTLADSFRYILYDGTGFSNQTIVQINVLPPEPIPPLITGHRPLSVNEDTPLTMQVTHLVIQDPDNIFPQDFTLEVNDGQNYSRVNTTITPAQNFNGALNVPVRVFDGTNFSNLFSVRVNVLARNDPPFSTGTPPDQEAIEQQPFSLALAGFFDDIDALDTLTYSASGLPASGGLQIDPQSGVLSGVANVNDVKADPYSVTVTATDSGGLSASLILRLTVFADNRSDLQISAAVAVNPVTVGENASWDIEIENLGPADVEEGTLTALWSTSGPPLSLTTPAACAIVDNNTSDPIIRCSLNGLAVGTSVTIAVQGSQDADGDNSLLAFVEADDPNTANNSVLVGSQVVAQFSEGPAQILDVSGSGVASGDLDGDGLEDLVVTSGETKIFLNSGNRTVATPGTSLGVGSGGSTVVILDWNGDTANDIAVAGTAGTAARIYLNNGNAEFTETFGLQLPILGTTFGIASADFDQNGLDDLALTGTGGSDVILSAGGADFSSYSLPAGPGIDISTTDINNDSSSDIIVVESVGRAVQVMQNAGNGSDYSSQSLQRGSVAGVSDADLNGDGITDLLLAVDGSDMSIPESRILIQQSDGSFPDGDIIGASPLIKMLPGDVNGDSIVDIVALNAAGVHQLYRGLAGGAFELSEEQIVSDDMRGGVLVDFNSDQSLDLILAGPKATVVEIHANNGAGRLGLGDRVAPSVQLVGEPVVSLVVGANYVDPGATAMDDIDGDLTASVEISGAYNPSVVGSYTLTYTAADKAGNLGSVSRVINVGINERQGGGGGGMMSPVFLLLQMLMLMLTWSMRRSYWSFGPFDSASRTS